MKEYLPIGSVVEVNDIEKKLMIVGFSQVIQDDTLQMYDYVTVIYPLGVFSEKSFYFINSEDIKEVIFTGYDDEERQEFLTIVEESEKVIAEVREEIAPDTTNNDAFE